MPKYIRYLQNNEWKYATVKDVGDISKIKTKAKGSLVEAINELIDEGILVLVDDISNIHDKLGKVHTDLTKVGETVDNQGKAIQDQAKTIENQIQLYNLLKQVQDELATKADHMEKDIDKAKTDLLNKADIDYVNGELVKKIDIEEYQRDYNEIKDSLLEKVSLQEYQEKYTELVEQLGQKANSIDVQTVINSINNDIANQQEEVDNAKKNIINLDSKVDTVKSDLVNTIDIVRTDFNKSVSDVVTKIDDEVQILNSNISFIEQKTNGISARVATIEGEVSEQEEKISSHATSIEALSNEISLKAEKSDVYTKSETDGKISGAIETAKAEIKVTTDGIKQEVSNIEGKFDESFETVNQTISDIEQKADSIQQTVSSISQTVTEHETKISNHETRIGQTESEITLKANASDVYKKSEVDTKLGKKVDTTTFNNKMSQLDVSIDGIQGTVLNQQTKIDNLTGTVQSHTNQISTLSQRADGFDIKVSEFTNDIDGLEGRLSSAETQISTNTNAINLKASKEELSSIDGRLKSAEGQIEVQAGQISQRVTKTEYDENVGLNKWIVSRYNINLGSSDAIPKFEHLHGSQPSEVIECQDAKRMQPFSDSYYIAHFFTNVYLNSAKTVTLNVDVDDTAGIYLNGAMIREGKGSLNNVSLSFRAGWNTVEILLYEHTNSEYVDLGVALSSQVDKLTAHIGIGDKNDTRLAQAETKIIQTADAITSLATKTEVTSLGNIVTEHSSQINQMNDRIENKVEKSTFNNYTKRLENAESNITQLSDEITQKVSVTEYNLLNNTVKEQETKIQQLNESIAFKVDESVIDGLNQRITNNETEISLTKDEISLKADKAELDEVSGRLSQAEAKLLVQSDKIESIVQKTDYLDGAIENIDDLAERVNRAETIVTQTATEIASKANKSDVYTKTEVDGKVSVVTEDLSSFKTQTANNFNQTVKKTEVYTKGEVDNKLGKKVDTSDYNGLVTRVANAESAIDQTEKDIALRVTKTEFENLEIGGRNLIRHKSIEVRSVTSKSYDKDTNTWTLTIADGAGGSFGAGLVINSNDVLIPYGRTYIVSFEIWSPKDVVWTHDVNTYPVSGNSWNGNDNDNVANRKQSSREIPANQWTKVWFSYENTNTKNTSKVDLYDRSSFGIKNDTGENLTYKIRNVKGELGTRPTEYTPAPEDVSDEITEKVNSAKAEIKITTDGISQTISNLSSTVTSQGQRISANESSINTLNGQISSKVTSTEVNSIVDSKLDKLVIGGRNLLFDTTFEISEETFSGLQLYFVNQSLTNYGLETVKKGGLFTFSGYIRNVEGNEPVGLMLHLETSSTSTGYRQYSDNNLAIQPNNEGWFEYTVTLPEDSNITNGYLALRHNSENSGSSTVEFHSLQLEEGNKRTTYTPAPEDISEDILNLSVRMNNAEEKIEDDSIIHTVTSSVTFINALDEKANAEELANYATTEELDGAKTELLENVDEKIQEQLDNLNLSTYTEFSELKQETDNITANFTSAGGVNLLKNSVGFAGFEFWDMSKGFKTVSNTELEKLGFGSGFETTGTGGRELRQHIYVVEGKSYTLSWWADKRNSSTSNGSLYFQFKTTDNETILKQEVWSHSTTTNGFEFGSVTYIPDSTGEIMIRIYGYPEVDATITGLMLNVGEQPLQWTMAHGEIYNTSVRMDMKGIRVSEIKKDKETRFTVMTPEKFAGYYDVNGDGIIDSSTNSPDEVFRMDEDNFIMKKAVIKEEVNLGNNMRISRIESSTNNGWAFIPM
jgi:predicted  nucleic acid-binding Zn-ribbon protein